MMAAPEQKKTKRAWRPWWLFPVGQQPICPTCNVACVVVSSPTSEDGRTTIQHRRCPKCKTYTTKTPVQNDVAEVIEVVEAVEEVIKTVEVIATVEVVEVVQQIIPPDALPC